MQDEHLFLWPTFVLKRELKNIADLNAALLTRVRQGFVAIDNAAEFNLWNYADPCIQELRRQFHDAAREWLRLSRLSASVRSVRAWVNSYQHGQFISPHRHGAYDLVGSYYVTAGGGGNAKSSFSWETDHTFGDGGHLLFLDPRGCVPFYDGQQPQFRIEMAAGLLVIFPGFLLHGSAPHIGASPRICIGTKFSLDRGVVAK